MSKGPHWTKEEIATLKQNASLSVEELEAMLPGRERQSIRSKLKREGLYREEIHSKQQKPPKVGDTFDRWTVLAVELQERNERRLTCCLVECSCPSPPSPRWVPANSLRTGSSRSCGCLLRKSTMQSAETDSAPKWAKPHQDSRLAIVGEPFKKEVGGRETLHVLCRCECGNDIEAVYAKVVSGHTKSCGCLNLDRIRERNATHGEAKTKLYKRWVGMMARCYNKRQKKYKHYGARGITVCEEWHQYEAFAEWAKANGWSPELSLDRANNDLPYSPANCRWVGHKEQMNNTTRNRMLTCNGRTQTMAKWAEEVGVSYSALVGRLGRGWSVEKALSEPSQKKNKASTILDCDHDGPELASD